MADDSGDDTGLGDIVSAPPGMLRSITKKRMLRRPGKPDVEIGEDGQPLPGAGGSSGELLMRKRRRTIKRFQVADTPIGAMGRNGGPGNEQG